MSAAPEGAAAAPQARPAQGGRATEGMGIGVLQPLALPSALAGPVGLGAQPCPGHTAVVLLLLILLMVHLRPGGKRILIYICVSPRFPPPQDDRREEGQRE